MEVVEKDILSEEELVERCLEGGLHWPEVLYKRYADKMYNICLTYSDNDDDARDNLQEGFIRVFKKLHTFQFQFKGGLEGWIRKIVVNTSLELYRKKKREKEVIEEYSGGVEQFSEGILEKINASELVKMVNELPTKAAMVLKLHAIEGYAHKEIAELMGITVGTSKSQLNRARFLMKEEISKANG